MHDVSGEERDIQISNAPALAPAMIERRLLGYLVRTLRSAQHDDVDGAAVNSAGCRIRIYRLESLMTDHTHTHTPCSSSRLKKRLSALPLWRSSSRQSRQKVRSMYKFEPFSFLFFLFLPEGCAIKRRLKSKLLLRMTLAISGLA